MFKKMIAFLFLCSCAQTDYYNNHNPYMVIQTGPDKLIATGPDPNVLQGLAFKSCQDINKNFDEYEVVSSTPTTLSVHCQKHEPSFKEKAEQAWDEMKHKAAEMYDEYGR